MNYYFSDVVCLNDEIEQLNRQSDLSEDIAAGLPKDKLVYIYTSGTTGMPKAAVITNLRYDQINAFTIKKN